MYRLNTLENAMYFSSLKGISTKRTENNIRKMAQDFNFSNELNTFFQNLSTGLKKKAAILVGAAMGTEVLLLDEPSNGLDIAAQKDLASFILDLKIRMAILFLFHRMTLRCSLELLIIICS